MTLIRVPRNCVPIHATTRTWLYVTENYSVSTDVFAVIVKTPPDGCVNHQMMSLAGELEWRMRQVEGVEDVRGLNVRTRQIMMGINEGFPKWQSMFRNQDTVNYAVSELVTLEYVDRGLFYLAHAGVPV